MSTLTIEQVAELLAGIVRAQQAIIDAVESENGGWKNTHLVPKVTTAANMRLATPRLVDVPARVLLRSQGRVPMDVPTIVRTLQEAMAGQPAASPPPGVAAPAVPVAAAAAVGVAAAAESTPAGGGDDLGNFFDT